MRLTREEKEALKGVAREAAGQFLDAELRALQSTIEKQEERLRREDGGQKDLPRGQAELMQSYQERKALLGELKKECAEKALIDAFRERLERANRRMTELRRLGREDSAARSHYLRVRAEREMVSDLMGRWLTWIARSQANRQQETETEKGE